MLDLEVDFYWPERRLVVETDGFTHHGSRFSFEADRWRDLWLRAGGYEVVRCTWRQINANGVEVIALLEDLLRGKAKTA